MRVFWYMLTVCIALNGQELDIRFVANAGVSLHCGGRVVLVDALFREGVQGYDRVAPRLLEKMESAQAPFDGVKLVLATHRHKDHFDADSVRAHLAVNGEALFVGTAQTVDAVGGGRRVKLGLQTVKFDGGSVRLHVAPHNAPAGRSIENAVVDLNFCGQRLVISGDAEIAGGWFDGLAGADWALVPWWFLTSESGKKIVDDVLRPKRVYALHGVSADGTWKAAVRKGYPNARIGEFE